MKQAGLLALTMALILLSACAKPEKYEEKFTAWRESCLSAAEHEIKADVTASDDEKVCEYTFLYNSNVDGETVEVLAPELISKVRAEIKAGETQLCYDGAALDTGSALMGGLSPLMSLSTFMDIVGDGHIENSWTENKDSTELTVTELEMPDGTLMTVWQKSDDMTPVYAEIRSGDTVQLKLTITEFK